MSIAAKKSELRDIANKDKADKIRLESPFTKDLTRFFKNINNEFENYYIARGSVLDAREFNTELNALLLLNYKKISNVFKFNIRESFHEKVSRELDATINADLTDFADDTARFKSNYILQTTNAEIKREIENTTTELIQEGKQIERVAVAVATKKALTKKVEGRANTIAITETAGMSEGSKEIEKEILIRNNVVLDGKDLKKKLKDVWVANLDERTRPAHMRANGQIKGYNDSFIVGGEYLKYPGDPAGSIGNIINCRCSLVSRVY